MSFSVNIYLFFQVFYDSTLEEPLIRGKYIVRLILLFEFVCLLLFFSFSAENQKNSSISFEFNKIFSDIKFQIYKILFSNLTNLYIALIFPLIINFGLLFFMIMKIFVKIGNDLFSWNNKVFSWIIQIYNHIFFIPFLDISFFILLNKKQRAILFDTNFFTLSVFAVFNITLTIFFGFIICFLISNHEIVELREKPCLLVKYSKNSLLNRVFEIIIITFYHNTDGGAHFRVYLLVIFHCFLILQLLIFLLRIPHKVL